MPNLTASGNIFTLDGRAGFDEGLVRGKVGASARLSFDAHFALCHGLDAALSAQAMAQADAALGLLWVLTGRGQGQALAGAGVQLDARIGVDLFDEIGLSADASAFVEASVAGRLALGLDLQDIARLASEQISGLALQIFIAALNEVVIEAGVWGKASLAAMAKAHLNVRGSLRDDDRAGFVFEMGTEIGWGAGAGYEFFAGMRFDQPKRFFLTASELLSDTLADAAAQRLPPHLQPAVEALRLLLPVVLNAAYTLGQDLALGGQAAAEALPARFNETFLAQLQRFVLDHLARAGVRLVALMIDEASEALRKGLLEPEQRQAVRALVESLIDRLGGAEAPAALDWDGFGQLLLALPPLLEALAPEQAERWRVPLTITWSAVAAARALREGVQSLGASASAGAIGLSTAATRISVVHLPDAPDLVRDEYASFFDSMPPSLELRHAIEYLLASGVAPLLEQLVPELALVLGELARQRDSLPGAVVEAALQGTFGGDLSQGALYQQLRSFAKQAIDGHLLADVLPELRRVLGPQDDVRIWIDEAAQPSLQLTSEFVFGELDRLVAGGLRGTDWPAFGDTLRTGFSVLAGKLVVNSAVVLGDILFHHLTLNLHTSLRQFERLVQQDPAQVFSLAGQTIASTLLPPFVPPPPKFALASQQLLAELVGAAADANAPDVWTAQRRQALRALASRLLLSVDGALGTPHTQGSNAVLAQIFECAFVPDPDGLLSLHRLLMEVLQQQLDRVLPRIATALGEFFLSVTLDTVDAMDRAARDFIDGVARALQAAWDELQRLRALAAARLAELQAAARALADRIDEAAVILRSQARRTEVLARLKLDGITAAEQAARAAPGFGLLPAAQQRDAVALAIGGFSLAFELARPALNEGLRALGTVADDLAALVDAAADLPDLMQRLLDAVLVAVRAAVNDALGAFGVMLPAEVSVADVANAAKDLLDQLQPLRDALEAALRALATEREARARERQASINREAQRAQVDAERDRQRELLGGELHARIVSPLGVTAAPMAAVRYWAYGPEVPLRLRLAGARLSFVQPGAPRRVLLAINGRPFAANPGAWTFDADSGVLGLDLVLQLAVAAHGLQPGANVIECSVADGVQTLLRERVVFAIDPTAALRPQVVVDGAASLFDTVADDHEHTPLEQVTLRNIGNTAASLRDWVVADKAGHRFRLPDLSLLPGLALALHTGPGVNGESAVYWGRRQAVWNNRGDTVLLYDAEGVLRDRFDYGHEAIAPRALPGSPR